MNVELGLDTFGDVTVGDDGERLSDAQTIRDIVDQAVLADQVGLSFFGVGSTTATSSRCRVPRSCWLRRRPVPRDPPRYGRHRPLQR
jgi:hypothetical protein